MKYEDPLIDESQHGNVNVFNESPMLTLVKSLSGLALIICIAYFLLSFLVRQWVYHISFETERRWFEPVAESLLTVIQNDPLAHTASNACRDSALQGIADKIKRAALAKDPNHPLATIDVTMHYGNDDVVNAFALPAGHIIVMRGLIEATPNENALAMVVAHEMAHVIHRDAIHRLGRDALFKLLLATFLGDNGGAFTQLTTHLTESNYSQATEKKADEAGLALLYDTYQNAYGATHLFETLAITHPTTNKWLALSLSHPLPERRVTKLKQTIQAMGYPFDESRAIPMPLALTHDGCAGNNHKSINYSRLMRIATID